MQHNWGLIMNLTEEISFDSAQCVSFFSQCCCLFYFCGSRRRTLADIIMEKITEKQTEVQTVMSEVSGCPMPQLDPRIMEVYKGVGKVSRPKFRPVCVFTI